ncbi:MAG: hypothetical protein JW787_05040 [Sedimentisphaerales bacterium]|nr:hypothetical protein [Sedimentisphaerales bacterium]
MKENQNFNKDEVTLKSLKAKLRSIGELDVPVTLKAKLLDAIPREPNKNVYVHPIRQRFGIWGYGASAAIVLILVVIIIINIGPSISPHIPHEGINNPNDLNDSFIQDTNLINYNLPRLNIERESVILTNWERQIASNNVF